MLWTKIFVQSFEFSLSTLGFNIVKEDDFHLYWKRLVILWIWQAPPDRHCKPVPSDCCKPAQIQCNKLTSLNSHTASQPEVRAACPHQRPTCPHTLSASGIGHLWNSVFP